MAHCKRCDAPIRWGREGSQRFTALNEDGTPHNPTCPGASVCRNCGHPVVWKDHEGKRHCFEQDGKTLHKDVCVKRHCCNHCGRKLRWVLIDGRWAAFDASLKETLHWSVCVKNPDAAKAFTQRFDELTQELSGLRQQVVTLGYPNQPEELRKEIERLRREIAANDERHRRELAYRDVELRRLTAAAERAPR